MSTAKPDGDVVDLQCGSSLVVVNPEAHLCLARRSLVAHRFKQICPIEVERVHLSRRAQADLGARRPASRSRRQPRVAHLSLRRAVSRAGMAALRRVCRWPVGPCPQVGATTAASCAVRGSGASPASIASRAA
jgi:hypothetical protein